MTKPRRTRRYWTEKEVALLRELYPDSLTKTLAKRFRRPVNQIYAKANQLGLNKSAAFLASAMSGRLSKLTKSGVAFRFPKGHTTWNKGMKGWNAGGRSVETRFKPGNVSRRWDPEVYIVGALRINTDGGLDIKLHEGLRSWYPMARWVWETERGPIPRGMVVRALNGDEHDTRIENLRLATRAEVMRENTLHNYPKPIARAIQLRGALNRRINSMEKKLGEHA